MSGSRLLGRDPTGAPGAPGATGLALLVPILLRLYPRGWRARYEGELLALLEERALTPSAVPDIVLAALDAWLSGEYPSAPDGGRKARRPMPAHAAPLALVAGGILVTASLFLGSSLGGDNWEFPASLLLLGFPIGFGILAGGIAGWTVGDRHADRALRGLGILAATLGAAVAAAMLGLVFLGDGWWYVWSGLYVAFTFASGGLGVRLAMVDRSRLVPAAILVGGIFVGLLEVAVFAGLVLPDGVQLLLLLPLAGWVVLGLAELTRDRAAAAG